MANGYVLYQGPSLIDGNDIVVIATGINASSKNSKTGGMIQTYILVADEEPHQAVKSGKDATICGDCVHRGDENRGRSCYVNVGQGPLNVYRAWKRGNYPSIHDRKAFESVFKGRKIRFGAYGDPAAVPALIWQNLANVASGVTGYTHQWRTADPVYAEWCMASADSVKDAQEAQALGYRTFRVSLEGDVDRLKGEAVCPASKEAGYKLQCHQCLACDGNWTNRRGSITIKVHGNSAHRSNAKKLALEII